MNNLWINPAWLYFLGALGLSLNWAPKESNGKTFYLLGIPILAFFYLIATSLFGDYDKFSFLGQTLIWGHVDLLSRLFGIIFIIMSAIGIIYGLHEKDRNKLWVAILVYVGGALGVVFSGDYISVFIFSEIMAFSSVFLIWLEKSDKALKAGFRYIMMHIFGGVCLLGGIVIHYVETHSIMFIANDHLSLGSSLILIGFLVNAAVPPLSAWLADAYPEATIIGSVFLSAFTTKTAVYCLIRTFPGTELLIWLGAIMAIYGVVYAVLENDIRRLLAYHIISQVGYMVAAVGIGTFLALNGASAHAFSHILYKGLLFMGAGAVIHVTGKRKLTELGGLYRYMPITLSLYMIGAFSISAFPLFSGFVSKSMVLAAAEENHLVAIWLMLTLASAGTFLHTGLKLPYYTFFGNMENKVVGKEPPKNMLLAMGIAAILCVAIGIFPGALYSILPYFTNFHPYTFSHIIGSFQLLLFTLAAAILLINWLDPHETTSVDTDWVYRKGLYFIGNKVAQAITYFDSVWSNAYQLLLTLIKWIAKWFWRFDMKIIDGMVNGVGNMVKRLGEVLRKAQTGQMQHYALVMVVGMVLMMTFYLITRH